MNFSFIETPSKPGTPEPVDITNDTVTLFWKTPDNDGNSVVLEYILEYQEKSESK